jgi:hypothetical protein
LLPSPSDLELAFSTDPLVGWRLWRVEREIDRKRSALELALELRDAERAGERNPVERLFRHRLRSLTQADLWPPRRRLESTCGLDAGAAVHAAGPDPDCDCGVWALKMREHAFETLLGYAQSGRPLALGRISLWGRIVEGANGWRGQYAYPLDLELYGSDDATARDLAADYGVAVVVAGWPGPDALPGSEPRAA